MKKVFSLILALALMLGLFPQISLQALASDDSTITLCYDDHVDMTGKVVQIIDAGQGPVIVLDGNHLVATGIGRAQVRIDGTAYTVTVDKAKLNLIMIMGQSNAGNHFENATSDVTCPVGTAYWWGNGLGTAATEPVPYTQPSMGFHTPLLAELYAQSVAAGDPVKNVMIWHEDITSKDGQSIVKWASSATDTSGTDDAVTMLENCRAYYQRYSDRYEIVSSGVYWLQGESDLTMDPTQYTQLFMAMWQRLKAAGMEYLAFFRVRREIHTNSPIWDDLFYSASLSAQIQMINDNPEFYMATTLTENWVGGADDLLTVDISKYITVMQAYGKQASYSDAYGNTATYADGKLTTTMRSLYGSNNYCHYGKFGYGLIGADAAYNMYRALHGEKVAFVVTDTSGYASRAQVLASGQTMTLDISNMTDNLSFRGDCGSTGGTLKFAVRSSVTDITAQSGVVISSGEKYGSVSTSVLRGYPDVSILLTYTTADGDVHTAICHLQNGSVDPKKDYVWDFNEDLNARGNDGEILNSFLGDALAGSYKIENGYLTASGLQLALENTIELHATRNWSIEWKYGALNGSTAGFLLSQDKGNTIGNKALWHIVQGNPAIADYLDSQGYRNYTCDDIILKDYDQVKLTNSYDPIAGKSTVSLWLNGELVVADLGQKGSLNGYGDDRDMSDYPLIADFAFRYLGNSGLKDWFVNCQLDYLKISFGETQPEPVEETYYLVGFINGANYGCEEDSENMGQYLFEDGQLTATFTSDSYVFLKTENNGKWLMSDAYCEDRTCTFVADGSEKMKVPAYVAVTFTLVENEDGSVTLSYVTSADQCSHSYTSQVTTAATCTASGVRTCICSKCGHRYTESIPATGHSYSSKVTTAATCTTAGVNTFTCTGCQNSYTESIPATSHSFAEGECSLCGAVDPDYSVPDTGYTLVTDMEQITAGGSFVIVANNNGSHQAMDTTLTSGKFTGVDVTVSGSVVTGSTLPVWTIQGVEGGVTIRTDGKYLAYKSSTNFQLSDTPFIWNVEEGFLFVCDSSRGIFYRISSDQFGAYAYSNASNSGYIAGLQLYQDEAACRHSYTAKVTTVPTCETAGVRTYTCSTCGDSYTESISATGHNYCGGFCTVCGAADPSVPISYYLFGYINGANYACEEDYENMGIYQFVDGKLTATFTTDSYVGVKTEGNGRWFMTDGWLGATVTSATLYDTNTLFAADKLYVPGGVQVTFTLKENADGTLTLSYVTDSASPSTVPTISLKYPSLSFEDVIIMNVYYTATDMQDVVEMGLITNTAKPTTVSIENADQVIPGYGVEGSYYFSSTAGIAPKDISDTIYFAVYAKLADGTCTYTKMIGYSPKTYAMNQLSTGSADMRPLVAAMLNYGAAAQTYFGYKTDALMNADMTDAQKALVASYNSSMIAAVTQASGSKVGSFVNDGSYTKRYPTISFEGAFCINYYFQPNLTVKGDVMMYLWTLEDFNKASVLTKGNATKAVKMTLTESGEYLGVVDGIAAKDLDKAVYVSFVYSDGTTEHCGGVIGYTIGLYCKSQAAKTGTLADLSKACAVYGYYAKQLFQ